MYFKIMLLWCLLFTHYSYAIENSKNIEEYLGGGISAEFIEVKDPDFIKMKLSSGEIFQSHYKNVKFNVLYSWEKYIKKTGRHKWLKIYYSFKTGVVVFDPDSRINFKLIGYFKPYPIEIAVEKCINVNPSTVGIKTCKSQELKAWDAELNRYYQFLGGRTNENLKAVQQAWLKFRDMQIKYLKSIYSKKQGTIWGVIYMYMVTSITEDQAKQLMSIYVN